MLVEYTKDDLISFEEGIASLFNEKKIKAPIHLYNGNEDFIIDYFSRHVEPEDYVLCTWRSHYQCLLKGVPKEILTQAILSGKSISLSFPEYNILSSGIVTGTLPIATGIALGLKKYNNAGKVHVFCGDMTAQTGIFHECYKYSCNFDLPITFIIEDNDKSVCTSTSKTWGYTKVDEYLIKTKHVVCHYTSKWPHAGAGSRIQF